MNRQIFYNGIRKDIFGKLNQSQVNGIDSILNEAGRRLNFDSRWLAYILATAYHETAKTMQPVREYGRGRGKEYGKIDRATGKAYYGRGHVQLTWNYNYKKMARYVPGLYENPDLALVTENSVRILFEGMIQGMFTGKRLSNYFNEKTDWVNARRIVNGLDRAHLIAGYALEFYSAIIESKKQCENEDSL